MLLLVAAVAAAVRATTPFEHGWWLVAYLALVGGLAQFLLAPGSAWLVARVGALSPPVRWRWWAIGLWNIGALAVPVGVLANAESVVLGGSVLLLAALGLFAAGLRWIARRARRPAPRWIRAHWALIVFLGSSVFVGAHLAEALPWH